MMNEEKLVKRRILMIGIGPTFNVGPDDLFDDEIGETVYLAKEQMALIDKVYDDFERVQYFLRDLYDTARKERNDRLRNKVL